MKRTASLFAFAICVFALPAAGQVACGQPPVTVWTVQFFERWEDAAAKMVGNAAYRNTMSIVPVSSLAKNGYVVSFAKEIRFTNECPPLPVDVVEQDTTGWHRQVLDTPALAEAFVAALPAGTPVAMTTLHAGYSAGQPAAPSRRRGATHSSIALPSRGIVVTWFDGE